MQLWLICVRVLCSSALLELLSAICQTCIILETHNCFPAPADTNLVWSFRNCYLVHFGQCLRNEVVLWLMSYLFTVLDYIWGYYNLQIFNSVKFERIPSLSSGSIVDSRVSPTGSASIFFVCLPEILSCIENENGRSDAEEQKNLI